LAKSNIKTLDGYTLDDIVNAVVAVLQALQTEPEPASAPEPVVIPFTPPQLSERKLLTKQEAAEYIGIHKRTLTNIINAGGFYPLVRVGYGRGRVFVNREKLDQWIDEQDGAVKRIG
jgi:excisionase family DNA binding protein